MRFLRFLSAVWSQPAAATRTRLDIGMDIDFDAAAKKFAKDYDVLYVETSVPGIV